MPPSFPLRKLEARRPLSQILLESRVAIQENWLSAVRQQIRAAADLDRGVLIDSLLAFVDNISQRLRSSGVELKKQCARDLLSICRSHGIQRTEIPGYSLEAVITEYRILRQETLKVLTAKQIIELEELDIILDSFCCGLTEAATEFAHAAGLPKSRSFQLQHQKFRDLRGLKEDLLKTKKSRDHLYKITSELERNINHQNKELTQANERLEAMVQEQFAVTGTLRQSERFLDSLIENLPDMIFVKDAKELRFVRINRAGEALLGYNRSELLGKNDYDFFPTKQADFFVSQDRATISKGAMIEIPEEKISTRQQGLRILHTKKIPVLDELGNPQFLLGISEDITEKKGAEEQRDRLNQERGAREEAERQKRKLEEALEIRDRFISSASHELKTPLTSLKLQVQMVRHYIKKGDLAFLKTPKMRTLIESTDDEIKRIEQLVSDMLDVSRIRLGKLQLNPEYVSLEAIVTNTVDRMREAPEKLPAINVSAKGNVVGCWDRYRMGQVVTNLLSNAIKYGEAKPIEVLVEAIGTKARMTVLDHGQGIAKENQSRIFQMFERITVSKSIAGLGIGLFITKEIVLAHKGTIWVESELGEGSKFIVELPTTMDTPSK